MSDEKLKVLAKDIFGRIVDTITFPPNVKVIKDAEGTISFYQQLSNATGSANFFFIPDTYFIEKFLKNPERLEAAIGKDLVEEFTIITAESIAYALFSNFYLEIEEGFGNFVEIPFIILTQLMSDATKGHLHHDSKQKSNIEDRSNQLFIDFISKRDRNLKERIKTQTNSAKDFDIPNKNLLGYIYPELHSAWKEAKKFYKQNKNFKNIEQLVLTAFPDLPDDLITRLTDIDPYISTPSAIALEHAARFCGFHNNSIELRTLQNYLKESRFWLDKKSEEEKEKELNNFLSKISDELLVLIRISDSMGEDFKIEKLPFVYQLLYKHALIENETTEND